MAHPRPRHPAAAGDGSEFSDYVAPDPTADGEGLPTILSLGPIAPNPFNPRTALRFGLTREQHVRVDVYDLKGRRVVRLFDDLLPRGHHSIDWLGQDSRGRNVASGVYFARLKGHDVELTERLTLVR